jgi:hypothetical protein
LRDKIRSALPAADFFISTIRYRMNMFSTFIACMTKLHLVFAFLFIQFSAFAQSAAFLQCDSLHAFPGKSKPNPIDFSAALSLDVQNDSIIIKIKVSDEDLKSGIQGDRVEVWFALPDVSFSDYIIGGKSGSERIFRNSAEPGDNARLKPFISQADYPDAPLEYEGKMRDLTCPPKSALQEHRVLFGMTHFVFTLQNGKGIHTNRNLYEPLKASLGWMPDDLSHQTQSTFKTESGGYTMRIAMHVNCLGFSSCLAKKFKICVDVFDLDAGTAEADGLSSARNRFYARPQYFNLIETPNPINVRIPGVDDRMIKRSGILLNTIFSGGKWQPFGFGAGPLIFCEGHVSEAGLVEFNFYPIDLKFETDKSIKDLDILKMTLNYKDATPFRQEDVYFLAGEELVISKGYCYRKVRNSKMVNRPFKMDDGSLAFVLYDFEPAEPLGWGAYGKMADEFIYIQKVGPQNKPLFSGGQRLEVLHTATLGETDNVSCENVEDVEYNWIETGKRFKVKIKGLEKKYDREFIFKLDGSGEFRLEK